MIKPFIEKEMLPYEMLIHMQAIYSTLKNAERKAADLLLGEPKILSVTSISDAAAMAGCSEPTFTRVSRKLGYSGYPELKADLVAFFNRSEGEISARARLKGDTEKPRYGYRARFATMERALRDTVSMLDEVSYANTLERMKQADMILFLGSGSSFYTAFTVQNLFAMAGFDARCCADVNSQRVACNRLTDKSVCVVFSHSGRTRAMVTAARQARAQGACVVSVTNFPVSPLNKQSTLVLLTAAFDELIPGFAMSSRILQIGICESLLADLVAESEDRRSDLERTLAIVEALKQ